MRHFRPVGFVSARALSHAGRRRVGRVPGGGGGLANLSAKSGLRGEM